MKTILIILVLVIMTFSMAYAEAIFGLRVGGNLTNIAGDDVSETTDNRLGVNAGFAMQYSLTEFFILQPELLYNQKGYKNEYSLLGIETDANYTFHYVEMPILFKYSLNLMDVKIQPYIGPEIRYLVDAKSKIKTTVGGFTDTTTGDIDGMNNLDLGLALGADLVLMNNFMIGARYNMGLTTIDKENNAGDSLDQKNVGWMLNLGLLFY